MKVYDLVFGSPWQEPRKLTEEKVDWQPYGRQMDCNGQRFQKQITQFLCRNAVRNKQIICPSTAFDHLWASEEVVEAFPILLGECQGLLGAWPKGITIREKNPRMLNARAGAAAVDAAEEWQSDGAWMTETDSPRHKGRHWTTGDVYCEELSDPAKPWPLPIPTLPEHATMQTWLTRIGPDIVNVELVPDDRGRFPAQYQELTYPRKIQVPCGRMQRRYGNSRTALFNVSKGNTWGRAP